MQITCDLTDKRCQPYTTKKQAML